MRARQIQPSTSSSSGGGTFGSIVADFGGLSGQESDIVIAQVEDTSVTSASKIVVTPRYSADITDHDAEDYAIEGVQAVVGAISDGVGFDIIVSSRYGTWGQYNIDYTIGA